MNHVSHNRRHVRGGKWRVAPAMTLGLALLLTGCEDLLEVSLPGTITVDDLKNPDFAEVLVNSAVGQLECAYSRMITGNAVGMEDIILKRSGGPPTEYQDVVQGTSACGTTLFENNSSWFDPMQEGRFTAEDTYSRLTGWTDDEVARGLLEFDSREQMLGVAALYASIPYTAFGEFLCEVTVELGPLLSPDAALQIAEDWVDAALGHIQQHIIDFVADGGTDADARAYPYGITDDSEQMAHGLRARIRWARGNLTGAAADAALVTDGFVAVLTRNGGVEPQRRNHIWAEWFDGDQGLDGTVAGPIDWWIDPSGGTNPGGPWPDAPGATAGEKLIPFTGYLDLAIAADGRAVDADGNAITTATAGSVADTRVPVLPGTLDDGNPGFIQQKVTAVDQPVTLVNWQEMILIRAEEDPASAVALVNVLRAAETPTLPDVTYAPNADDIEDMIIEERRRALFLEGRFWSTKIQNQQPTGTKLWFPRELEEQEDPEENTLQGGVRMRMESFEFDINPNISRADRATLCGDEQRPVNPTVL